MSFRFNSISWLNYTSLRNWINSLLLKNTPRTVYACGIEKSTLVSPTANIKIILTISSPLKSDTTSRREKAKKTKPLSKTAQKLVHKYITKLVFVALPIYMPEMPTYTCNKLVFGTISKGQVFLKKIYSSLQSPNYLLKLLKFAINEYFRENRRENKELIAFMLSCTFPDTSSHALALLCRLKFLSHFLWIYSSFPVYTKLLNKTRLENFLSC